MRPKPIIVAIEKAGSVKALAGLIGVTPQCISQWKRVPVEHVRIIENITGMPRHEIREDVYEVPPAAKGRAVSARPGKAA